ncbi:MAG: type II toxin-antitoxin system PemK/MazF family toxin [Acidimicrobiia bacterium]|nr:type II toxin-antitoxin system PemK/MazF family toxin [Acidimicrobiia bacterium]
MTRCEIWWYEPPDVGRRPYLILTRSRACDLLNQVIAVPATRTVRNIPTEVPLDEDDGMPGPCVLNLDNVTLVRPALCTSKITTLGPERMREVCVALGHATEC